MTISEKIQQYRKSAGLSQEELARNLLVSRQTISLWENGQTLPTIDNLIRLRDIFGVSLDDMLCTDKVQAATNDSSEFDEVYQADASPKKIARIRRTLILPYSAMLGILFLLLCITVSYVSLRGSSSAVFTLFSILLTSVTLTAITLTVIRIRHFLNACRNDSSLTMKINDEIIVLERRANGEIISFSKHPLTDVRVSKHKDFIQISSEGEEAYLEGSALPHSSRILALKTISKEPKASLALTVIAALTVTTILGMSLILGKPLARVERYSGVKIPEYVGITENEKIGLVDGIYVDYYAELFISADTADVLESSLASSDVWQVVGDGALSELIPMGYSHLGAEYFVHREYKTERHVIILYFADENMMSILLTKGAR